MMKYLKLFKANTSNIILYHGTHIDNLTKLKPFSNKYNNIPPSIFLTDSRKVAKNYGKNIYKCKLVNCNKIKEIELNGESFHNYYEFEFDISDAYNEEYDCVIFKNIMDSKEPNTIVELSDVYVVFDEDNVTII